MEMLKLLENSTTPTNYLTNYHLFALFDFKLFQWVSLTARFDDAVLLRSFWMNLVGKTDLGINFWMESEEV
jgi:hypothetical protein